jgi:hypothetical protein
MPEQREPGEAEDGVPDVGQVFRPIGDAASVCVLREPERSRCHASFGYAPDRKV